MLVDIIWCFLTSRDDFHGYHSLKKSHPTKCLIQMGFLLLMRRIQHWDFNRQKLVGGWALPLWKMVVVSKMGTKSQNSMARSDHNDHIWSYNIWLVVSTYPSEKWWSESQLGWWKKHNIWKNIKCSKPPTSLWYSPTALATANIRW